MRVLDDGHRFELAHLDGRSSTVLQFVKRIGDNFPGNAPPACEGVTTQEVLRALISRTTYVNAQKEDQANYAVLRTLRGALTELEMRAARERGHDALRIAVHQHVIETLATCFVCGHVLCLLTHEATP